MFLYVFIYIYVYTCIYVCMYVGTIWLKVKQKESNDGSGSSSNNYNRRHTKDFNTNTHWQAYVWTKSGNITHTPRCTTEPSAAAAPRRLFRLLLPKQKPQRTEIKRKQAPFDSVWTIRLRRTEKAGKLGGTEMLKMGGAMLLRGTDKSLFTKIVLMQPAAMQHGL